MVVKATRISTKQRLGLDGGATFMLRAIFDLVNRRKL